MYLCQQCGQVHFNSNALHTFKPAFVLSLKLVVATSDIVSRQYICRGKLNNGFNFNKQYNKCQTKTMEIRVHHVSGLPAGRPRSTSKLVSVNLFS